MPKKTIESNRERKKTKRNTKKGNYVYTKKHVRIKEQNIKRTNKKTTKKN